MRKALFYIKVINHFFYQLREWIWALLQKQVFYVLLTGLSVHVGSNLLWTYFNSPNIYFTGRAIGVSCYLLSLLLKKDKFYGVKESILFWVAFELSINDLCDELFFSPTTFNVNELILLVVIIITTIVNLKVKKKRWTGYTSDGSNS